MKKMMIGLGVAVLMLGGVMSASGDEKVVATCYDYGKYPETPSKKCQYDSQTGYREFITPPNVFSLQKNSKKILHK